MGTSTTQFEDDEPCEVGLALLERGIAIGSGDEETWEIGEGKT